MKPNVTTYNIDTHQESISFYPYCSSSECETTFNPTNAEVNYKLKGHEKFPLREGWMNKGISVAKEKGTHIFLENQDYNVKI